MDFYQPNREPNWLLLASDSQTGHKLGLLAPGTILEESDTKTPALNESQEWLWEVFCRGIYRTIACTKGNTKKLTTILNGDLCHGNIHAEECWSPHPYDQIIAAEFALRKTVEIASTTRIVMGTGAHTFGIGSSEKLVADEFRRHVTGKDIRVVFHGYKNIAGINIDYAHHGPHPGSREWLKGDNVRRYARNAIEGDIKMRRKPADLIIRSHYHEPIVEQVAHLGYTATIIITPPLCVADYWTLSNVRYLSGTTSGMMLVKLSEDGAPINIDDVINLTEYIDLRTKEE